MKNQIIMSTLIGFLAALISCAGQSRALLVQRLASFEMKADLATRQIYASLDEQKKLDTHVNALVHCVRITQIELDALRSFDMKMNSMGKEIVSVNCKARVLPQLADLEFVKAIESAKRVNLR